MAISNYIPPKFPHEWLPEKVELKTWEQIEPWYQAAPGDAHRFGQ